MTIGEISIKLTLDSSGFSNQLKSVIADLRKIEDKKLKLNIETTNFNKTIGSVQSTLKNIGNERVAINVDNVKALSGIELLKARLNQLQLRANEISVNPNVKESTFLGLQNQIGSVKSRIIDLQNAASPSIFEGIKSAGGVAFGAVTSAIGSTISKLVDLGKYAILGGTALAGIAAVKFTSNAADVQAIRGDLEVLLGSATKTDKVISGLKEFADFTPFQTADLVGVANKISTVEKDTDKLLFTTKALGEVSGGNAQKFDLLALAYTQVKGKGRLMGQELNQLTENGFFNLREELSKLTGIAMPDLAKAIEDGKISSADLDSVLQKIGGNGFPRLEKASKTLGGLFSTTKERINDLGLAILGIDTKTFETKAGGLADTLQKILISFNSDKITQGFAKIGDAIGTSFSKILSGIDFEKISNDIANTLPSIASAITNTFNFITANAPKVTAVFNDISNAIALISPYISSAINQVISFVQSMIQAGNQADTFNNIKEIISSVGSILLSVGNILKSVFIDTGLLSKAFEIVSASVGITIDAVKALLKVGSDVLSTISDYLKALSGEWEALARINKRIEDAWNGLVGITKNIFTTIKNFIIDQINSVIDNINGAFGGLGVKINRIQRDVVESTNSMTNSVINNINNINNTQLNSKTMTLNATDLATPVISNVNRGISSIPNSKTTLFNGIDTTSTIIPALNANIGSITTNKNITFTGLDLATPTANFVKSTVNSVPKDVTTTLNSISNNTSAITSASQIKSTAQNYLNNNPVTIQSVLSGTDFSSPRIGYSKGGIVKGYSLGGTVQGYANGGDSSGRNPLLPRGEDLLAGLKIGEYVINRRSSERFRGVLDAINYAPNRFESIMNNLAGLGSTTNNKNNNFNVNVNIAKVENGNQFTNAFNNVGYLLHSALQNRGI